MIYAYQQSLIKDYVPDLMLCANARERLTWAAASLAGTSVGPARPDWQVLA